MKFLTKLILILLIVGSINFIFPIDPRYHTYEEMCEELNTIVTSYSNITRMETIGYSTGFNLPILAVKISDNPNLHEDEPRVLFTGIHHACELIGVEICLALLWELVTKYELDSFVNYVVNNTETWVVPMVNPDGHHIVMSGIDTLWRKNCRDNNNNGVWDPEDGVDLNRNYDFLWHLGGSSNPLDREYRGPYPFSENETRAIRNLAYRERFIANICFHSHRDWSYGEAVYYPWRWGNSWCPDHNHIRPIAESIAVNIPSELGSGYTYSPIYGRATEGGLTRNWLYYAIGCFSYTIEVSRGYFPAGNIVDTLCKRNLQGVFYLYRRLFSNKITGHVYDSITLQPLQAEVRILEAYAPPETTWYRVSDSVYGRFYRLLSPGNYTLQVIKPGYNTKTIYNVPVTLGNTTQLEILLSPNPGIDDEGVILNKKRLKIPTIIKKSKRIEANLGEFKKGKIDVFSSTGQYIATLSNFNSSTENFSLVLEPNKSGIYFLRLQENNQVQVKKIIFIK
ncbi:MAG: M14 family zinc carboxypeptidase [candidate division WOR-3 bacterium]|nr:M14 family zinc carboxypeptidase [candidate division WOR-3 bacterium]MDW7987691.1 M14 family zinc carboxypeptidase [candidate division WOR-3 bacterium]